MSTFNPRSRSRASEPWRSAGAAADTGSRAGSSKLPSWYLRAIRKNCPGELTAKKRRGAFLRKSPKSGRAPEKLHTLTELNESSKHGHGQYNNTPAKGAGLKTHLKRHKKEPPPSSKRRELSFSFVDPWTTKKLSKYIITWSLTNVKAQQNPEQTGNRAGRCCN